MFGHLRITGDDLVDLGSSDSLRHLAKQRIGDRRRCPHRQPRVHRTGLTTVVVDLGEDRDAVTVNGVGDRPIPGDHITMEAVDQLLVRPIRRMRRMLLGDDQAGAAGSPRRVVRSVLLGRLAIAGVVGEVGAEDDAVADGDGTERQRSPQVPVAPSPVTLPRRVSPGAAVLDA